MQQNIGLVIGIAVAALGLAFALGLLLSWVRARGVFMFLDGVVRNRGDVARPWTEYARESNSLFVFQFCLGLACSLVTILVLAGSAAIAWPDIRAGRFGADAVAGLVVFVPFSLLFALANAVFQVLLIDFVAPIMYVRRLGTTAALKMFLASIVAGHLGTMILYLLLRLVIGIAAGLLAVVITCATCCLAALPYVGTVLLLPIAVFQRAFPLYVLEQYGPEWQVFPSTEKTAGLIFDDLAPPTV